MNLSSLRKNTEPNQALQTTTMAVTDRAPSSTLRASHGRVWSITFGKTEISEYTDERITESNDESEPCSKKRIIESYSILKSEFTEYMIPEFQTSQMKAHGSRIESEPNQALQTMTVLVTPRAEPRVAPSTVMSDL